MVDHAQGCWGAGWRLDTTGTVAPLILHLVLSAQSDNQFDEREHASLAAEATHVVVMDRVLCSTTKASVHREQLVDTGGVTGTYAPSAT
jgi:hypothetical protein